MQRDGIYTQEKDLATATRGMTSYNDHPLPPQIPFIASQNKGIAERNA